MRTFQEHNCKAADTKASTNDDDLRRDIAFALMKHIRSKRPGDADSVRYWAAADVIRHLRLCGRRIEKEDRPVVLPTTP